MIYLLAAVFGAVFLGIPLLMVAAAEDVIQERKK